MMPESLALLMLSMDWDDCSQTKQGIATKTAPLLITAPFEKFTATIIYLCFILGEENGVDFSSANHLKLMV